jgi:hypothetical protein
MVTLSTGRESVTQDSALDQAQFNFLFVCFSQTGFCYVA